MIQTQPIAPSADEAPLVRLFFRRTITYKIGFILLFLSFVIYIFSFGSSSWFYSTSGSGHSYGLWQACDDDYFRCYHGSNVMLASQITAVICLVGYCVTIILGLLENLPLRPANLHSRKVEWTALATAFVGSVSSLLFILFYTSSLSFVILGSSYFTNALAVAVLFVSGGMMACGHEPPRFRQGMVMSATPQQQTTVITFPGPQLQTNVYTYNSPVTHPPPQPQLYAPYNPAQPNVAAPPPAYGASPPPPYVLPPTYPNQGNYQSNQQPPSFPYQGPPPQQQQLEASAPLLPENEIKRKL